MPRAPHASEAPPHFETLRRSPSYPLISLEQALRRLQAIYANAGDREIEQTGVLRAWSAPAAQGKVLSYFAALKHYGLLDTVAPRRYRVSPLGLKISKSRAAPYELFREAALLPQIFREIYDRFGIDGATESAVCKFLIDDRLARSVAPFSDTGAKEAHRIFHRNVAFARLKSGLRAPEKDEAAAPSSTGDAEPETSAHDEMKIIKFELSSGLLGEIRVPHQASEEDMEGIKTFIRNMFEARLSKL